MLANMRTQYVAHTCAQQHAHVHLWQMLAPDGLFKLCLCSELVLLCLQPPAYPVIQYLDSSYWSFPDHPLNFACTDFGLSSDLCSCLFHWLLLHGLFPDPACTLTMLMPVILHLISSESVWPGMLDSATRYMIPSYLACKVITKRQRSSVTRIQIHTLEAMGICN